VHCPRPLAEYGGGQGVEKPFSRLRNLPKINANFKDG
jgi:hypothetical protein